MHLCIGCYWLTRTSDGLHILSCACQHGPLSWWQVGLYSLCLLLCQTRLAHDHLWMFFVLQGALSNTLTVRKIFRALLCSWGFHSLVDVSVVFRGVSEVFGKFSDHFHVRWLACSVRYLLWSLILFLGWRVNCSALIGLSSLQVPCVKGAPKFLEGMLLDCEKFPGKSSPWILFLSFCDKEGLDDLSYLLSKSISYVAVFPLII